MKRDNNIHTTEEIGQVRKLYDGTLYPDIQINTCRNIDRLFPTRVIARGGVSQPLPIRSTQLENVEFSVGETSYDLYDYIALNRVTGTLVVKEGEVAFEKYFAGNNEKTRWMSMSVAKSISAILAGVAIQEGLISNIDDPVTNYLPRFKGSAYEGVTVRHLLQMTSGVAWNETYTDP